MTIEDRQLPGSESTSSLDSESAEADRLHAFEHLDRVYSRRFTEEHVKQKDAVWQEIARHLQRHVPKDGAVLDIACDRGYFIRHVVAREKWASDIRDVRSLLPEAVRFVQSEGVALDDHLPSGYFDVVFMSNYLEHLDSGERVIDQLRTVARLLKPTGIVIILQPNIRLVGQSYWDFIDHRVALTEKSLVEAAELAGFHTRELITRFLPYTTKSGFTQNRFLVRMYLRLRLVWPLLGKQTLYIGDLRGTDLRGA